MGKINDGGPAFPQPAVMDALEIISASDYGEGGMTLRDYFAAKALPICMSNGADILKETSLTIDPAEFKEEVTGDAYLWADAMLEARKK